MPRKGKAAPRRAASLPAARIRDLHSALGRETNAVRTAVRARYAEGLTEFGAPAADAVTDFFAALWVLREGRRAGAELRRTEAEEFCYWAEAADRLDRACAAARAALGADRDWAPMALAAMWQHERLRLPAGRQAEARGDVFDREVAQLLKNEG